MPKKISRSQSLSPEELTLRTVRARRRFKALVRLVIANLHWLEDVEDEQLSRNVKKNVQLLTKKKGKKSLLTLQQKSILCKPAEERSDEEKQLLFRIIGGLKCFRKYPENVKMALAGVTYFVYYPAGRVIVRQNQEAHALYFIVTGEVQVSITSIDPVIKEEVTTVVGTMVPGSMFGEVSLLHDIPRTATITTATPCEFLSLKKADFDIVLKASVIQQWAEIKKSMSRFTYFTGWDEVAVRECCIYSKIKPYVRDQTILGDGFGLTTSTYFIIKGKCRVIEHLFVEVSVDRHGKKHYKLFKSPEKFIERKVEEKAILDERKGSVQSIVCETKFSEFTNLHETGERFNPSKYSSKSARSKSTSRRSTAATKCRKSEVSDTSRVSRSSEVSKPSNASKPSDADESESLGSDPRSKPAVDIVKREVSQETTDSELPANVETHFMQVCILSETACFGLGENMKHRRVVAMSDYVECLLIPRYWLLQKNKGNIWTRIKQYLNIQIPSTQQVFEEFLTQRKWIYYRQNLVAELFGKPPVNAYYNIPYSIRINEDIDFE